MDPVRKRTKMYIISKKKTNYPSLVFRLKKKKEKEMKREKKKRKQEARKKRKEEEKNGKGKLDETKKEQPHLFASQMLALDKAIVERGKTGRKRKREVTAKRVDWEAKIKEAMDNFKRIRVCPSSDGEGEEENTNNELGIDGWREQEEIEKSKEGGGVRNTGAKGGTQGKAPEKFNIDKIEKHEEGGKGEKEDEGGAGPKGEMTGIEYGRPAEGEEASGGKSSETEITWGDILPEGCDVENRVEEHGGGVTKEGAGRENDEETMEGGHWGSEGEGWHEKHMGGDNDVTQETNDCARDGHQGEGGIRALAYRDPQLNLEDEDICPETRPTSGSPLPILGDLSDVLSSSSLSASELFKEIDEFNQNGVDHLTTNTLAAAEDVLEKAVRTIQQSPDAITQMLEEISLDE